jgi:hypothetical protein
MKRITYLLSVVLVACTSHSVRMNLIPEGSDASQANAEYKKLAAPVAILNTLGAKSNGLEVNASGGFQKRFLNHLKEKKIFGSVIDSMPTPMPVKYTLLDLTVNENKDAHRGGAFAKGFFIGLTLLLLSPVLEFQFDFESEMTLTVTKSDGQSRQYHAKGNGTADYKFFSDAGRAVTELASKVTTNNLNSLTNQLSKDADFFR